MNNKLEGARDSLLNSIQYLELALKQNGVKDTKKVIAEEVAKAFVLSKEQLDFIKLARKDRALEQIESSITLLQHMAFKNEVDKESISMIIKMLKAMEREVKIADEY